MRIGLFGGTFDPIHWGHLRSAEEVREAFDLDRVFFIPASIPPHKRGQTQTPARDRLEMVLLGVAKNPRFTVSTVEISRPGVSYSIDTIRHFAEDQCKGALLYFIIGLDAFAEIGTWKDFGRIFRLCNFIVTSRLGNGYASPRRGTSIAVRRLFCYDFKRKIYTHRCGSSLHFVKLTDFAVSASDIRDRVRQGKSIRYLMPSSVESYIKKHGLYQTRTRK